MDILEEIVAHKRVEIDERKRFVPLQQFTGAIQQMMDEERGPDIIGHRHHSRV